MVDFLLDTHTLIWMQDDSKEINRKTKELLQSSGSRVFLSIASLWEITIKIQLGKLKLEYNLNDIGTYCLENNIKIVPVSIQYLNQYLLLPLLHKDPFDRIIVATAMVDKMSLISKDQQLSNYNIDVIW